MTKMLTNAEWEERALSMPDGEDYVWLDTYAGMNKNIRVKHKVCGCVYTVRPYNFCSGKRCPKCAKLYRRTPEEWKQVLLRQKKGADYTWLEPVLRSKDKPLVRHEVCKMVYRVRVSNFMRGVRCPYCHAKSSGVKQRKSNEDFLAEVLLLPDGDSYHWEEPYVTAVKKIRVTHTLCGKTYMVTPNKFLSGCRCPYCYGNKKYTNEEWLEKAVLLPKGGEYKWLSPYVNSKAKMQVEHTVCSHVYSVTPSNFIWGKRCPYCFSSTGEDIIESLLSTAGVSHTRQAKFKGLVDSRELSYDFFLEKKGVLIEYNGYQHYYPVEFFGGEKTYEKQVLHDNMKARYALNKGYTLKVVPYWLTTSESIKQFLGDDVFG